MTKARTPRSRSAASAATASISVKELLKEKQITEDEARRGEDDIQKLTDKFVKDIDDAVKAKEQELMAV